MRRIQMIENLVLGNIFILTGLFIAAGDEKAISTFLIGIFVMAVGSGMITLEALRNEK